MTRSDAPWRRQWPSRDAAEAYLRRIDDPALRERTRARLGLDDAAPIAAPVVHAAPTPAPSVAPRVDEVQAPLPPPRPGPSIPGILTLTLPWPPSLNAIWRAVVITGRNGKPQARVLLSQEGRDYRRNVKAVIASLSHPSTPPAARLALHLKACPPDRRARDLSNLPKALEDALTHAHVWADDSLIDELHVTRGEVRPGGCVLVTITPLTQTLFGGHL